MSLRRPQFEWTSTGELTFQIEARMDYGERKNWKDTKTAPLEKKLSSILSGLTSASISTNTLREKEEARNREWAEMRIVALNVSEKQKYNVVSGGHSLSIRSAGNAPSAYGRS